MKSFQKLTRLFRENISPKKLYYHLRQKTFLSLLFCFFPNRKKYFLNGKNISSFFLNNVYKAPMQCNAMQSKQTQMINFIKNFCQN